MALVGEMQYLTIGNNTYSLPSGGGGGTLYVTFTYDDQNDEWSCNKTAQQIYEAYDDGNVVIAHTSEDNGIALLEEATYDSGNSYYEATFTSLMGMSTYGSDIHLSNYVVQITSGDYIYYNRLETNPIQSIYGNNYTAEIVPDTGEGFSVLHYIYTSQNVNYTAGISYGINSHNNDPYSYISIYGDEIILDGETSFQNPNGSYKVTLAVPNNLSTDRIISFPDAAGTIALTSNIPTKVSDLTNDSNFITGMTILSYGSSTWNDFETAYNANKVVYCRASSNSNPASGSQTRLAFMAYVNNATTPTNVEFQYYRSVSSHTASQQGDQVYVYKLDKTAGWTVTTREASVKVNTGSNDGIDVDYSSGAITIGHTNSVTAQTTQAVYPIAYDAQGHITSSGTAVTIPTQASDIGAQPTLVSGTNIKTINNNSLLGSGNITIASSSKNVWYATCSSSATTDPKVVTTNTGDFTLTEGNIVYVTFTNASGALGNTAIQLNVDGTGAVNVYSKVGTVGVSWTSGSVIPFVYNGTNFIASNKSVATTYFYGETILNDSVTSTSATSAATANAVKQAYDLANSKQDTLVSGTNIKTINSISLLGSGDIAINDAYIVFYDTDDPDWDETTVLNIISAHNNNRNVICYVTSSNGGYLSIGESRVLSLDAYIFVQNEPDYDEHFIYFNTQQGYTNYTLYVNINYDNNDQTWVLDGIDFYSAIINSTLKWTATTSSNTYYPLVGDNMTATKNVNTLYGINFYQNYNTAGGYRRLSLGTSTSWTSSGGAYGTIRLYGAPATYYGDLVPGTLSTSADGRLTANRTWTLPNATGELGLVKQLTQAQYNALSSDEKNNGTVYYISDSTPTPSQIGIPHINLTQAQYDTLTEAEKDNGNIYFITDSMGGDPVSTIIGTGVLDTTAQTLIGGINELSTNYIVDEDDIGNWHYRKWSNGKIEAWGTHNNGSTIPSEWTTGWYYKDFTITMPTGIFSAKPTNVVATNNGTDYQYMVYCAIPISSTQIVIRVVKPNSNSATPIIAIYASNMV